MPFGFKTAGTDMARRIDTSARRGSFIELVRARAKPVANASIVSRMILGITRPKARAKKYHCDTIILSRLEFPGTRRRFRIITCTHCIILPSLKERPKAPAG